MDLERILFSLHELDDSVACSWRHPERYQYGERVVRAERLRAAIHAILTQKYLSILDFNSFLSIVPKKVVKWLD